MKLPVATNPWDCGSNARNLAVAFRPSSDVISLVARFIHSWPSSRPAHFLDESERCQRLVQTLAGYPLLPSGVFPVDDPFEPLAAEALSLSLLLDDWSPLVRNSLRAEILWLDRLRRAESLIDGVVIPADQWLRLILGWLMAGLAVREPDGIHDNVLFDVLYDAEEREGGYRKTTAIAARLTTALQLDLIEKPYPGDFGRPQGDTGVAEYLWWARRGAPLNINRRGLAQSPQLFEPWTGTMEVKFHRIQSWLTESPSSGNGPKPLRATAVRGASQFLEIVMSQLRHRLLSELGAGNVLIDGGGRLRIRCPESDSARQHLATLVQQTLNDLFLEGRMRDRFEALIARLVDVDPCDLEGREDQVPQLRRLAWALVPPLSVTFGNEDPSEQRLVRIPIRRGLIVAQAGIGPGHEGVRKRAWKRGERGLDLASRIRVELGVLAPRLRLLDLRLGASPKVDSARPLPRTTGHCIQVLHLDLNRVGDLFSRARNSDSEQAARRNFRFTAHWLLAIRRTCEELARPSAPEVLMIGGDDLLVATRSATGDLLAFALRLHDQLGPLNHELPPCDGVSFAAGLARQLVETPGTTQMLFETAGILGDKAKHTWRNDEGLASKEVSEPSGVTALELSRVGTGRRCSVVAAARIGEFVPQAASSPQVIKTIDLGPITNPWSFANPVTDQQRKLVLEEVQSSGKEAIPPFEVRIDELEGRASLIVFDAQQSAGYAKHDAQSPCCLAPCSPGSIRT